MAEQNGGQRPALRGFLFFGRYLFEKGSPGAYVYRIELLQYMPGHPEGAAYLEFLAESGIEVVASSLRWVYLRKKKRRWAL